MKIELIYFQISVNLQQLNRHSFVFSPIFKKLVSLSGKNTISDEFFWLLTHIINIWVCSF